MSFRLLEGARRQFRPEASRGRDRARRGPRHAQESPNVSSTPSQILQVISWARSTVIFGSTAILISASNRCASQRARTSVTFYSFNMGRRMFQFVDYIRVNAVQRSPQDLFFGRLPYNSQNRNRDQEANDRVGLGITEPDPNGSDQHSQTGPSGVKYPASSFGPNGVIVTSLSAGSTCKATSTRPCGSPFNSHKGPPIVSFKSIPCTWRHRSNPPCASIASFKSGIICFFSFPARLVCPPPLRIRLLPQLARLVRGPPQLDAEWVPPRH